MSFEQAALFENRADAYECRSVKLYALSWACYLISLPLLFIGSIYALLTQSLLAVLVSALGIPLGLLGHRSWRLAVNAYDRASKLSIQAGLTRSKARAALWRCSR